MADNVCSSDSSADEAHLARFDKTPKTNHAPCNAPSNKARSIDQASSVPNLDLYDLNLDPWRYSLDRKKIV